LERHGFEYRRNGTLSLYAALDVKTGKVQGKTAARHTSAEFVDFLDQVVSGCKPQREIHIILDNLSAHKTAKVQQFLERHSNVKLHFTPTYSSWLNQVEIWFARLEREVIARGIFTSVKDLARKLMRYIRAYSKTARPFKWKYTDVRRRILPCSRTRCDGPLVVTEDKMIPPVAQRSMSERAGSAVVEVKGQPRHFRVATRGGCCAYRARRGRQDRRPLSRTRI